jgi:hypothetical protein
MSAVCCNVGTDLHIIGLGSDGHMYHTIRNSVGLWQSPFGAVESQSTVERNPPDWTTATCAGLNGELHVIGLINNVVDALYTIRNGVGIWQAAFGQLGWQGENVGCAGLPSGLHVLYQVASTEMAYDLRAADGSWQGQAWGIPNPENSTLSDFGCASAFGQFHVVALSYTGQMYHLFRNEDGTGQDSWGLVESEVAGGPASFMTNQNGVVDCAGVGDQLHVVVLGNDGQAYHTIRNADGSWQPSFEKIDLPDGPGKFTGASCAGTGNQLQVVLNGFPVV